MNKKLPEQKKKRRIAHIDGISAKDLVEAMPIENDRRSGKKEEYLVQRRDGSYMTQYFCPACERVYLRKSWNYCPKCGIYVGE